MRPQDLGIGKLFESIRDAAIVANAETGQIVLWNPAAEAIFGYSSSEALGMSVEELVPDHLKERHRAGMSRYRDTGHGRYIDSHELLDLPAVRKTGEEIRVELTLSPIEPIRDVQTGGQFVLAIVRDVTERKRAEETLRESEARFHALVQNALDIVMVTDAEGTIRYMSPSVERVLGYTSEEMVGTNSAEYVHPDDMERAFGQLEALLSKPGVHPVAVETRVRHRDGSWRHLEGIASNLLGDPAVEGLVFNHRDVTDRVRAEEEIRRLNEELEGRVAERTSRLEAALTELRDSEERYRSLVAASTSIVWAIDPEGGFVEPQPSWEAYTGQPWEAHRGFGWIEALHPDDRKRVRSIWEQARDRRSLYAADGRLWHAPSGAYRYFIARATPLLDADGSVREWIGMVSDVDDLKRAEEEIRLLNEQLEQRVQQRTAQLEVANRELEEANMELEAFSYSVSHDLRAPLRSIDGFSQILIEDYAEELDEEGRHYLGRVRAASQHMALLIDDLLNLSRVSQEPLRRETVDLSALATGIIDELRRSNPEREVEFVIADGLTANGDARLLGLALENLLNNAWKFTSKEDKARIEFGSVANEGGEQAFFVKDNGVGFDERYADKLFGVFQRLHGREEFEGTGIGLATVRRIVQRHGGRVWAEGRANGGATFYFSLPLLREPDNEL